MDSLAHKKDHQSVEHVEHILNIVGTGRFDYGYNHLAVFVEGASSSCVLSRLELLL